MTNFHDQYVDYLETDLPNIPVVDDWFAARYINVAKALTNLSKFKDGLQIELNLDLSKRPSLLINFILTSALIRSDHFVGPIFTFLNW